MIRLMSSAGRKASAAPEAPTGARRRHRDETGRRPFAVRKGRTLDPDAPPPILVSPLADSDDEHAGMTSPDPQTQPSPGPTQTQAIPQIASEKTVEDEPPTAQHQDGLEPSPSELRDLGRTVEALESRLADLNRFVDTLHAENEQLRRQELERMQHPVLRDIMKLHDDWAAMALAWRGRQTSTPEDVASKCADIADDAVLILARYGVELVAPAEGDLFDRKLHRAVAQVPAEVPGSGSTVASVRRVGYVVADKTLRFADVVVYVDGGNVPSAGDSTTA